MLTDRRDEMFSAPTRCEEWQANVFHIFLPLLIYLSESKVMQYFGNNSGASGVLPNLWRWRTTLGGEILSPLYTLRVLLTRFASCFELRLQNSRFKSDLAWSSRFFRSERNFLNHLVIVPWSTETTPFAQQMLWLLSQPYGLPIHNVSAHQLARYY